MVTVLILVGKELRDGLRNRWVLGATLLLTIFALTLAFLGAAPTGAVKTAPLAVTIVSLSSLSIFLLPLIALLLSHDAIVGEAERGTLALLLAYPVARWQVVIGKFLGHVAILAFATLIGFGVAAAVLTATEGAPEGTDMSAWPAFAMLIGSSVLLGAAFVAIGLLVSTLVRERSTAGGIAIGLWLGFVLIWDMALLGVLVADQGRTVTGAVLDGLLLLNPTDAYRLLNLTGDNVGAFAGTAGLARQTALTPPALMAALLGWVVLPLAAAVVRFARRPV
jgi:Cu-processing system permease protein